MKISKADKEFLKINKIRLQEIGSSWLVKERDRIFDLPSEKEEERVERDRQIEVWKKTKQFFKDIKLVSEDSLKESKKQDYI